MVKRLLLLILIAMFSVSVTYAQGKGDKVGGKGKVGGSGGSKGGGKGKGGLSGSGGGGGVICFSSIDDAKESDQWLAQNKQLPKHILDKGRLHVLEAWEMTETKQAVWQAQDGATWQQHLEKVKTAIRDRFPVFMYRLDQTADWTHFGDWDDVQDLPLLDDAKPMVPMSENCRRVQLVIRYSEGNNEAGDGPVSVGPRIKISFVKEYFDRLSVTDQAILMFHEQLYVLGQSVGHRSSDFIRAIVRLFFSDSMNFTPSDDQLMLRSPGEQLIREYLIRFLGDYVVYFHESNKYVPGPIFSSERHFYVYLQLMLKQRQLIRRCIEDAEKKNMASNQCLPSVMRKLELSDELTKEEAFVMAAVYIMEPHAHFNSDQVLDPAGRNPVRYGHAMRMVCARIKSDGNDSFSLIKKAVAYCDDWSLLYRPGK